MLVVATYQRTKSPYIDLGCPGQSEQSLWCAIGRMTKGMVCSRLYLNGIPQIDQFNPADCTMLVEIDDNVVGFDICSPALVKYGILRVHGEVRLHNIPVCAIFFSCIVASPLSTTLVTFLTSSSSNFC